MLLFITIPLHSEDKIFNALQINNITLTWADFGITTIGINKYQAVEVNPIARFYVENPGASIMINAGVNILTYWGLSELYKRNKTIAIITAIGINVIRCYILYNNVMELNKF